jgi:hypothetical protein
MNKFSLKKVDDEVIIRELTSPPNKYCESSLAGKPVKPH